jgi:hypothetical protein
MDSIDRSVTGLAFLLFGKPDPRSRWIRMRLIRSIAVSLAWPFNFLASTTLALAGFECCGFDRSQCHWLGLFTFWQARPSLSLDSNAMDSIDRSVTGLAFLLFGKHDPRSRWIRMRWIRSIAVSLAWPFNFLASPTIALAGFECDGLDRSQCLWFGHLTFWQARHSLSLDSNAVDSIDRSVTGLAFSQCHWLGLLTFWQARPSLSLDSNAMDSIDRSVIGLAFSQCHWLGHLTSLASPTLAFAGFECD